MQFRANQYFEPQRQNLQSKNLMSEKHFDFSVEVNNFFLFEKRRTSGTALIVVRYINYWKLIIRFPETVHHYKPYIPQSLDATKALFFKSINSQRVRSWSKNFSTIMVTFFAFSILSSGLLGANKGPSDYNNGPDFILKFFFNCLLPRKAQKGSNFRGLTLR